MKYFYFLTVFFGFFGLSSFSLGGSISSEEEVLKLEIALDSFFLNPKSAMELIPPKKHVSGPSNRSTLFSDIEIVDGSFIEKRRTQYKSKLKRIDPDSGLEVSLDELISGRAAPLRNDFAEDLVTIPRSQMLKNIYDIENKNLKKAELKATPWSDSYWPIYQGGLSARYADLSFPKSTDWKKNFDYFINKKTDEYKKDSSSLETLSPAEKYDLLVGDKNFTLSKKQWEDGEYYYKSSHGKVETWMGLCHGWAIASYRMDRPKSPIELLAADGKTKILFYPQDIKALATLLWSNGSFDSRFVGGRCNDKNPKKDENGRILNPKCFDTNPMTWHLVTVNQIGVAQESFVMDATYDYEVWNHPVISYEYTYFNPQTGQHSHSIQDAKIDIRSFSKDKFKEFRSKRAKFVIGVSMLVEYVVENDPEHYDQEDSIRAVNYIYDLELDHNGEIVGGEWYQNAHPDFMWTTAKNERALSVIEKNRSTRNLIDSVNWDGATSIPQNWQDYAPYAAKENQPLTKLVEDLILLSRLGLNSDSIK